jgi:hypothetical protein
MSLRERSRLGLGIIEPCLCPAPRRFSISRVQNEARHQLIFYRCGASITARWAAIRRTAGVRDHIINRRMSVGDAMVVLGRGQCREGSADQREQSAEKKYSSDHHVAPPESKGRSPHDLNVRC